MSKHCDTCKCEPAFTRYEYVYGRSSKFWEHRTSPDGLTLNIRYGRIGTEGVTQVKRFAYSWEAMEYLRSKVREKINEGYDRVW